MAPGGPAAGRGRGGKFKKFTRGGGKHFSRDLRPLDSNGNEIREKDPDASTSEEEEDEEEEESSEEEEEDKPALTREQRRLAAKAKKEAAIARKNKKVAQPGDMPSSSEEESEEDDMPANPNHSKAARKQATAVPVQVDEAAEDMQDMSIDDKAKAKSPTELSRKERDALEAQRKKEAYMKKHLAGETDEAKADLARLMVIREKREADAVRKQAEKEEQDEAAKEKRAEIETREAKRREAALGKKSKK
ncbi:hypothetical protein B7494_g3518 [Chlorociboria aeruginascens]|nr:hypothetical protein B7494_g3518 [Chlorociboria aeruginascens]